MTSLRNTALLSLASSALLTVTIAAPAQSVVSPAAPQAPLVAMATPVTLPQPASLTLPDAPEPVVASSSFRFEDDDQGVPPPIAKKYARTIKPGQSAVPATPRLKLDMAFHSLVSPLSLVGPVFSAGISQWQDSRPHYGTDSAAFGERFGAAEARQASQVIFSTAILSNVLREDPRYYILGHDHSFKSRVYYAATRVFVTRTDSGGRTANLQYLGGVFGANALTMAYYPDGDTDASRVVTRSLSSIAYRLGTNQLREFSEEIRAHIPFHKK